MKNASNFQEKFNLPVANWSHRYNPFFSLDVGATVEVVESRVRHSHRTGGEDKIIPASICIYLKGMCSDDLIERLEWRGTMAKNLTNEKAYEIMKEIKESGQIDLRRWCYSASKATCYSQLQWYYTA